MKEDNISEETSAATDKSRFGLSTRRAALASIAGVASLGAGALLILDRSSSITDGSVVQFKNRHSGKVLEVADAGLDNGDSVQQWRSNKADHQNWMVTHYDAGKYAIENMHSGKILGVANAGTNNGANIQQDDWTDGDYQLWRYNNSDKNLLNVKSKKVLEIGGWGTDNGDNAILWKGYDDNANQQWDVIYL